MTDDLILIESRTMRAKFRGQVDALDKVGALVMLPDTVHATVEMAGRYFEVPTETIKSLIKDHREELDSNGLRTLTGDDLRAYKDRFREDLSSAVLRSARLTLLPRSALLNIGQLLTGSKVAAGIRKYLILLDQTATEEHKTETLTLARMQERQDYKTILHFLKLGGTESREDYSLVQNSLYVALFDMTATRIKQTQPQCSGKPRKRGEGFLKSDVAKDYLTERQLAELNSTVLATVAQLQLHHPDGATAAQAIAAINLAASIIRTRQIGVAS